MRYRSIDWSIDVPDSWRVTDHSECTTFEPQTGDIALQVSAYRKDRDVTDDDLRDSAGDVSLTSISLPRFTGFESTSTEKQMFWRKYWLRRGQSMIFVTYAGPLAARGRENRAVEAMLHSLSASHATSEV